jgi:CheY-like chemotaxis protein
MSRIESGHMELREERFSFRDFLEQIRIIVGGQCDDKGLRFVCNPIDPLDEYYVGDSLKLKQAIINILGNSVKFTDPPGTITFTVEQAASAGDRATLRFTMADTGVGMDADYLPRLFEAFSQEDTGNTSRYGGSGLGMAITKSIVEMMGGEIDVQSEKGRGTTFTVSVTLGRAQAPDIPEVSPNEAQRDDGALKGLHLLIAEDQEMNAEILADLLELEDMSSEWAEDGERAVALFAQCEEGHFDAILMDMRMPVMDGLAATREIRRLHRPDAATVPIIALSANAFEEDVRQCLQAGMNAHLSKPVDIDLLKEALLKYAVRR